MSFGLYCMLFGILVVCLETDGGQLTWKEPLPILTVQDSVSAQVVHRNHTRLIEGTINASLSWYFNMSSGLTFIAVNLKLETDLIAVVNSRKQEVSAGFKDEYAMNWIPNQRITLVIFNVTTEHNGTFACEVFALGDGISTWKSHVQVDVVAPPSNIITSRNQTITAPAELTLNCSADGRPKPTITWTRVSDNTYVSMPLNITGGKNEENYRCTADNVVRKPLTKVVKIIILYKPENVSLNIPTKVCAGTRVVFECLAGAANPSIQNYTLYKFVAGLANSRSNQVGVFNETLLIEGLYSYICEASNSVGNTQSQNRTVEVQIDGSIKIAKSTIHVKEGASISVLCNFSGFHSQHVSWMSASNYRVEAGNILKFPNISRRYHGGYNCSASNVCGGDSKRVFIDVQYPVEATRKGQNYYALERTSKTLTCPVAGNPEPNITWYNSSGAPVSSGKELEAGKSDCYICVANNSFGTSVNIINCLIFRRGTRILGQLTIAAHYVKEYKDLNSSRSMIFVTEFVGEMNRRCEHLPWYIGTEVTNLSGGSVIVEFILYIETAKTEENRLEKLEAAISAHGTFGRYKARHLVLPSSESTTFSTPGSPKPTVSAGPPWAIIGAVAGGVLLLAVLVGVLTWWVHKQRKCRKDTKIHSDVGRHDDEAGYSEVKGAYARSGPPAANGTDGSAGQEIEVAAAAIPTYAVVDKSKKDEKQADEKPPEYAVVDKSKKEKQERATIPTYAAVDKSKKKKKSCEEVPAVYAEVEKSKKKKKKTNDKNPYENLDETKKEKKPGELLYADLGDFQNPGMPTVCISPQPLPAIKKADPYERTDYADITQFLKGNATLPPTDGNGDTEMKPKRPSKRNVQGNDRETPI